MLVNSKFKTFINLLFNASNASEYDSETTLNNRATSFSISLWLEEGLVVCFLKLFSSLPKFKKVDIVHTNLIF